MKLSEIQGNWEIDSVIDPIDISGESIKTPKLHSKYINILSNTKILLRKAEDDYATMKFDKTRYYRGEMTASELKVRGWDQFQKKLLKNEVDGYLNADKDVIEMGVKVDYLRVILSTLDSILKSIMSRSFDIKNYIEWTKYQQGEL